MSYEVPTDNADFRFTGAPYVVPEQPDFRFDGRPLVFYAPAPGVIQEYQSQWQTGNQRHQSRTAHYSVSLPVNASRQQSSQQANPVKPSALGLFWGAVAKKESQVSFSHGQSQKKEAATGDQWQQPESRDTHKKGGWDKSIEAQDSSDAMPWNHPPKKDKGVQHAIQSVDRYGANQRKSPAYLHPQPPLNFSFREKHYHPHANGSVFFRFREVLNSANGVPVDRTTGVRFQSNRTEDRPVILPWGFGEKARDKNVDSGYGGETDPDIVEKSEPEQPDIRESYLLMNVISVVTLPDRTPIELNDLEIELDIDSFSWSLTGQLWGASSLALIEPDENGPKQIEVDINGWQWVFIIERYSTDRRFGNERYTVTGSSRTQLLAAPYAPKRSKSSPSDLSAKQAITEELSNTGFTASYPDLNDYSTPDWIIPGGTFSYQHQTPMEVMARLATTAGSVIIPARANDQVSLQPRYPASPWSWGTATMVISLSANWRPVSRQNEIESFKTFSSRGIIRHLYMNN